MVLFYAILILSLILRLVGLDNIALGDECFSLLLAKSSNVLSVFTDKGNPFLYYFIIKLEYLVFHFNVLGYKLLSVVFNIGAIFSLWHILKNKFNLKTANIGGFLASINLVMIYYSHEIRCYSLLMMLSPLLVYSLFQTIQKRKNIYFVIYCILGIIAINTHYYETIFLFSNFIFGLIYLRKRKKECAKFILINFIIALSFLPFFALVTYKGAILDRSFNIGFEKVSFNIIIRKLAFIFGGIISFILSIVFYVKSLLNKKISVKKKLWLSYILYLIFSVLAISIILSILIRPMIAQRYFGFLVPLFIMFLAIIFTSYKNKIYLVIFLIWIILMQYSTKIKDVRPFYRLEQSMFKMVQNSKDSYVIIRPITKFYVIQQKELDKINIITMPVYDKETLQKNIKNEINYILKNNKNATIYTVLLNPKDSDIDAQRTCYFDIEADMCLWEIKR